VSPESLIVDANLLVAGVIAFAAGIVAFASPCVVPLVPGYLSYMTGLSGVELARPEAIHRLRVFGGGVLFTLGFAIPFTLLGFLGGTLAFAFQARPFQIVMGAIVVFLGLAFMGVLPFDFLGREARVSDRAIDKGMLGALPLGFVFGVGWTPCIGPALGAIFGISAVGSGANPARGGVLAFIFALGLGLPFILFGVLFHRAGRALAFLRRNARAFQLGGGGLLVAVGLAIATGLWNAFIIWLQPFVSGFEPPL
jgi:cytochrome c-type biogenesis protein